MSLVRLKFVPRCVTRLKVGTRFVTRTYQNRYLDCHSSHGTQVCHSYIWNLYWFVRLPTSVSAVSICHSTSHFGTRFVTRSTSVSDCHSSHIGILFVNLPHIDISARPEGDPIRHSTHIRTRFFIRATWYLICHSSRVPYLVSHSKQDIGT